MSNGVRRRRDARRKGRRVAHPRGRSAASARNRRARERKRERTPRPLHSSRCSDVVAAAHVNVAHGNDDVAHAHARHGAEPEWRNGAHGAVGAQVQAKRARARNSDRNKHGRERPR